MYKIIYNNGNDKYICRFYINDIIYDKEFINDKYCIINVMKHVRETKERIKQNYFC